MCGFSESLSGNVDGKYLSKFAVMLSFFVAQLFEKSFRREAKRIYHRQCCFTVYQTFKDDV